MKFVGKPSSTVGFKDCMFLGCGPSIEGIGTFVVEDCKVAYAETGFELKDVGSAYISNSLGATKKMISAKGGGGVLSLNNEHKPPQDEAERPVEKSRKYFGGFSFSNGDHLNRRQRRAAQARDRHKKD